MTESWTYKDIPISDYSVTHEVNPATGEIKLITRIMHQIQEEIIQSKSDQIRNALIDLGWTPPDDDSIWPENLTIQVTDGTNRKIEVLSVYFDDCDPTLLWVDVQIDGVKVGTDRV